MTRDLAAHARPSTPSRTRCGARSSTARSPAGAWLRERELCESFGVARHSLRAALRALAAEGLVRIEPHRGAHVAQLTADDVRWLYELRAALELEAAHLALERNGGRLPLPVHAALDALAEGVRRRRPAVEHDQRGARRRCTRAIVRAARSPRIAAAHAALSGEMRLFLLALKPHIPPEQLADDHAALVAGLETIGPAGAARASARGRGHARLRRGTGRADDRVKRPPARP